MDADIPRMMGCAREKCRIGFPFWFQLRRYVRLIAKFQDLMLGANSQAPALAIIRHPHGAVKIAEVRVQRLPLLPQEDEFPGLIGRDNQRDSQPLKKPRKIAGVLAAERLVIFFFHGGRFALGIWLHAAIPLKSAA